MSRPPQRPLPPGQRIDPAEVLANFRRRRGLLGVDSKIRIKDEHILSLVYTPGVAEPCLAIQADPESSYTYTMRGNAVAVITDGSSVLSLGDAGPAVRRVVAQPPMVRGLAHQLTSAGADADAAPRCDAGPGEPRRPS